MEEINKESATYDSQETDELMTKELEERDDYGQKGVGESGNVYHDYPEDSNLVRPWSPSRNQQELWNRFKEWWRNVKDFKKRKHLQKEKDRVGRERDLPDPTRGEPTEGFWEYKQVPYTGLVQSPAFFMAMPAMKEAAIISSKDVAAADFLGQRNELPPEAEQLLRETVGAAYPDRVEAIVGEVKRIISDPRFSGGSGHLTLPITSNVIVYLRPSGLDTARGGYRIWLEAPSIPSEVKMEDEAAEFLTNMGLPAYFPLQWNTSDGPEELKKFLQKTKAQIHKEAADPYAGHNISITFEFTEKELKIVCTWDKQDMPEGINEEQALARIVQYLQSKLPTAFSQLEHITADDVDVPNRTIALKVPFGGR